MSSGDLFFGLAPFHQSMGEGTWGDGRVGRMP
jgi:hypothetical protein